MPLKNKRMSQRMLIMLICACLIVFLSSCRTTKTPSLPIDDVVEETPAPTLPDHPSPTTDVEGKTIAKIQGAGHISPYRNQDVKNVEGVVTVLQSDGFYLQSVAPDDDPATSEGIFVLTDSPPSVQCGSETRWS